MSEPSCCWLRPGDYEPFEEFGRPFGWVDPPRLVNVEYVGRLVATIWSLQDRLEGSE
jgi:hypothetical protein